MWPNCINTARFTLYKWAKFIIQIILVLNIHIIYASVPLSLETTLVIGCPIYIAVLDLWHKICKEISPQVFNCGVRWWIRGTAFGFLDVVARVVPGVFVWYLKPGICVVSKHNVPGMELAGLFRVDVLGIMSNKSLNVEYWEPSTLLKPSVCDCSGSVIL